MKKVKVTVVYPITVEIEIDLTKINDPHYVFEKQNEAKDLADKIFDSSSIDPIIHYSDCLELIE